MRFARFILAAGSAGLLAAVAGCQPQGGGMTAEQKADFRDSWNPGTPRPVEHPRSIELIAGPAPLIYQMPQSGTVHVVDASNGMPLATAVVGPGTIMRIDPEQGIFAGRQQIRRGPLADVSKYSIVLDVNSSDRWTSGIEAPKFVPLPATRPATDTNGSLFK